MDGEIPIGRMVAVPRLIVAAVAPSDEPTVSDAPSPPSVNPMVFVIDMLPHYCIAVPENLS